MATTNNHQFTSRRTIGTKQIQNIIKTKIKATTKFKTFQKTNSKSYQKKKKSLLFASTKTRSAATKPHQSSKSGIVFCGDIISISIISITSLYYYSIIIIHYYLYYP